MIALHAVEVLLKNYSKAAEPYLKEALASGNDRTGGPCAICRRSIRHEVFRFTPQVSDCMVVLGFQNSDNGIICAEVAWRYRGVRRYCAKTSGGTNTRVGGGHAGET